MSRCRIVVSFCCWLGPRVRTTPKRQKVTVVNSLPGRLSAPSTTCNPTPPVPVRPSPRSPLLLSLHRARAEDEAVGLQPEERQQVLHHGRHAQRRVQDILQVHADRLAELVVVVLQQLRTKKTKAPKWVLCPLQQERGFDVYHAATQHSAYFFLI